MASSSFDSGFAAQVVFLDLAELVVQRSCAVVAGVCSEGAGGSCEQDGLDVAEAVVAFESSSLPGFEYPSPAAAVLAIEQDLCFAQSA